MATPLPAGFLALSEAYTKRDRTQYNIIAVCVDHLPPAQSRGTDMVMKINVWDQTCDEIAELSQNGMPVRFFHGDRARFPAIEENGDVIVLRNIKTLPTGSLWIGLSSHTTTWNVISGTSLLDSTDSTFADVVYRKPYGETGTSKSVQGSPLSLLELEYAKCLLQAKDPSTLHAPPKSTALDVATVMNANGGKPPPLLHRKYRMLKDLVNPADTYKKEFADLLGEVRRIWLDNSPVEVKMTDYTEHPLLYDYQDEPQHGDTYGYVKRPPMDCPPGRMTIRISVWDEHGAYIRELARSGQLKLGMYMWVRNVQIKMDRDGTQLEAHLRGSNRTYGTSISLLNARDAARDGHLKDLLSRKREYDAINKAQEGPSLGMMLPPEKRLMGISGQREQNDPAKPSKNAKNKVKRRSEREAKKSKSEVSVNQNVRCEALDIPLTTIVDILDDAKLQRKTPSGEQLQLPFQNSKYKSKISVIDFFPDGLQDFAAPYKISEYAALSDHESEDESVASLDFARANSDDVKWQWHFFLIVEDFKKSNSNVKFPSTIVLQVTGQDGDYLLNMEACDLRENPQQVQNLKEKLFMMWGDLEEKKREHKQTGQELREAGVAISSKPFECMIEEFGVSARSAKGVVVEDEFERMFKMIKTNIG